MRIMRAATVGAKLQAVIGTSEHVAMERSLMHWRKTVRTDARQRDNPPIFLAIKDQLLIEQGAAQGVAADLAPPGRTIPCILQKAHTLTFPHPSTWGATRFSIAPTGHISSSSSVRAE